MPGSRCGIEAQVEQLEQVAREAGMAVERVGEVAQAERRAELAQIGGIGPQHRRLAPLGAGRDDQPIEAVVVGLAARSTARKHPSSRLSWTLELDGGAVGGLQHHVVQRDVALAVGEARA